MDAVNALGNGWLAALVDEQYQDRASADLHASQGAFNARDVDASLTLHVEELVDFAADADAGLLRRGRGLDVLRWQGGQDYWRVLYTAGYATVPEDVQEACAQWVASLFWKSKRDPGLSRESIPNAVSRAVFASMPPEVAILLAPHRERRIMRF